MTVGYTPYSKSNQSFSDSAHALAQTDAYPLIFGDSQLSFEPLPPEQARTLDADMGTDRHVRVHVHGLRAPYSVLVQERFRRPKFADFQDITITEWNHNSGQQGELYKIKAEMFLYGYYDETANQFIEVIAFAVLPLKVKIAQGLIPYTQDTNPRSNQTFLCFKFDDLDNQHISVFRKKWKRQDNVVGRAPRHKGGLPENGYIAQLTEREKAVIRSFPMEDAS